MPNTTLNYLYATRPLCALGFSGTVGTTSAALPGPGGQSGDGFPMPYDGVLTGLCVWDGATCSDDAASISFSAGDRISVYCQNTGSSFNVKVRVNGVSSILTASGVPYNSTLFATVTFALERV